MLPQAESACFVIADISGYTNFVSGVVDSTTPRTSSPTSWIP